MGLFHIGAVLALFFATPNRILLGFTVWTVVSSVGIGVCYHRLLTHQGFKTFRIIEYAFALIASLGQQGLAIIWVAMHRIHHRYTEEPGKDPHTPRPSFHPVTDIFLLPPEDYLTGTVHLSHLNTNAQGLAK